MTVDNSFRAVAPIVNEDEIHTSSEKKKDNLYSQKCGAERGLLNKRKASLLVHSLYHNVRAPQDAR